MKPAFALAVLVATAFCAQAQDPKPGCAAPPKDLVKVDTAPGTGAPLPATGEVTVNYTGYLYDGCAKDFKGPVFDTSAGRGPFKFPVGMGRVIKGWDEGVPGMKESGAKRTLIIPSEKAYGAKGAGGGRIPPNAALVFDIETVKP